MIFSYLKSQSKMEKCTLNIYFFIIQFFKKYYYQIEFYVCKFVKTTNDL